MIPREQEIDIELYNRRQELRELYGSPVGKRELERILKRLGVLQEIPCTEQAVALHNEGIRKLDEMGMLDEESLPYLIEFLIKQPVSYKSPVVEGE